MAYEFFDHTGDVGFGLSGSTLEEMFASAAEAFTAVVVNPGSVIPSRTEQVELRSPELDLLLRDWLQELLYRFDSSGFLPGSARADVAREEGQWRLRASVAGDTFDRDRHAVQVMPKAVTYHRLEVKASAAGGWTATIVLDI